MNIKKGSRLRDAENKLVVPVEKGKQGGRHGKAMHLAKPWACRNVPAKSWLSYNFPPKRMAEGLEGWV